MSKQKYTIENFASTVMILILIGFIATTGLSQLISENSNARQARANAITWQRLEQQQSRFEVRQARATQLFNGIKFSLLFLLNASLVFVLIGLAGYLAYKLAILARKSTQVYFEWSEGARHELKLEREYTKRLKYQYAPDKGLFQGLTLSGNLTYAPRTTDNHALNTSYTPHFKQGKNTPLELSEGSSPGANFAPVIQMPTFSDMLALPTPENMLTLGYDTNASPVYMPITSQVISGISGSGKTSTLTALATQLQQQNAQIVLCDSHRDSEQGLTGRLEPVKSVLAIDSAESVAECKAAIAWTMDEFNERRTSGKPKSFFSPLVLIFDEWLATQRDKELAFEAENIAHTLIQEGRKFNMHIWLAGQTFKAKHSTDSHHAIGQKILGKMTSKEARLTTGMSSDMLPNDTLHLQAGESYLVSWNDPTPQKIYTPYADFSQIHTEHLPTFSRLSNDFQPSCNDVAMTLQETPKRQEIGFARNLNETQTKVERNTLTTEEKRMLKLFKQGKSIREIVQEIYQVKSGSKYNKHLSEVQKVIRNQVNP